MDSKPPGELETDPRFPSGPWIGFFLQAQVPGRHMMELILEFSRLAMKGTGRDWVGKFIIKGKYSLDDGRCYWTKRYVGKHDVFYQGFNEGKGIWGIWEIPPGAEGLRGGFHIWPEGMSDPTQQQLSAAADLPVESHQVEKTLEPAGAAM
jgi:hypothetical protein